MQQMEQELPLLVYTHQLLSIVDLTPGCHDFYTTNFGVNSDIANALCGDNYFKIDTFDFKDKMKTCKAWMNIFLNDMTLEPQNYVDLLFITKMSSDDIETLLHSKDS